MEQKAHEITTDQYVESVPRMNGEDIRVHQCTVEQDLYKAAASGDVALLQRILGTDPHALDNCKLGYFGCSVLHVAANNGKINFVTEILHQNPGLCEALDSRQWTPLHSASVKGHVRVLHELLSHSPHVARVKTSHGDTILHLCLKHNQLDALKLLMENILDSEFANLKDAEGNTILHLAVMLKRTKAVEYLIASKRVNVDATNFNGNTALDIAKNSEDCIGGMADIIRHLKKGGARKSKHLNRGKRLMEKRDALMVVASLIATMAFQAGVSPPGGFWQDDSDGHRAGETVMAYNYPNSYPYFLRFNTVGFVGSLSTILLLLTGLPSGKRYAMSILVMIMWVTISAMTVTYAFSITVVTPKEDRGPLTDTIVVGVIVWAGVMSLLLIWHAIVLLNKRLFPKKIRPRLKIQGPYRQELP